MEALTHDLLEFNKVSRQEIALVPIEIEPIIEDLVTLRLPAVREAIAIQSPLHSVKGHAGLLQHVFSNLIDNAIKFIRPGTEPKITIWTEPVSFASPNTRSRPLIFSSSEDSGHQAVGAPSERLPDHIRM
jgi:signal transduction histidine kinase